MSHGPLRPSCGMGWSRSLQSNDYSVFHEKALNKIKQIIRLVLYVVYPKWFENILNSEIKECFMLFMSSCFANLVVILRICFGMRVIRNMVGMRCLKTLMVHDVDANFIVLSVWCALCWYKSGLTWPAATLGCFKFLSSPFKGIHCTHVRLGSSFTVFEGSSSKITRNCILIKGKRVDLSCVFFCLQGSGKC